MESLHWGVPVQTLVSRPANSTLRLQRRRAKTDREQSATVQEEFENKTWSKSNSSASTPSFSPKEGTPATEDITPGIGGVILVDGPAGDAMRVFISAVDSPVAIEHCLRSVFRVEQRHPVVLWNRFDDCAMPLSVGLVFRPGADGTDPRGPAYKLKSFGARQATVDAGSQRDSRERETLGSVPSNSDDHDSVSDMSTFSVSKDAGRSVVAELVSGIKSSARDPHQQNTHFDLIDVVPSSKTVAFSSVCEFQSSKTPGMVTDNDDSVLTALRSNKESDENMHNIESAVGIDPAIFSVNSQHVSGLTIDFYGEARDELRFWYEAAAGFRHVKKHARQSCLLAKKAPLDMATETSLESTQASRREVVPPREQLLDISLFDATDARVDLMYKQWTLNRQPFSVSRLLQNLRKHHGLTISRDKLFQAVKRAKNVFAEYDGSNEEVNGDEIVSKRLFALLWQRLLLGMSCHRVFEKSFGAIDEESMLLIEYNETVFEMETLSEEELLVRTPLHVRGPANDALVGVVRWLRCNSATAERVLRLSVKFYLHPVATVDAQNSSRIGRSKIERFRHQYFVTLEVYVRSETNDGESHDGRVDVPSSPVGPSLCRSSMYVVASGSPNDGFRNCLLSIVCNPVEGQRDPLDFFANRSDAAIAILDSVQADLSAHGRLREYKADFLMYTILDRAVGKMFPICLAYGHRLRWLQDRLNHEQLRLPAAFIDEASRMRLEMQELKLWVGQVKSIVKTLSEDSRATKTSRKSGDAGWGFGAWAEQNGKGLSLFLSNTDGQLDHIANNLSTMDELARSFLEHHQRLQDGFLNNVLLTLTIASAIFMPAQLLAGIYGTNFVDGDGVPAIPELRWKHGYLFFMLCSLGIVMSGLCLACFCLRR
eukprot:TRINITY_DN9831_c0_g1_i1.p1 TRINITY_DN9831_c0_g1~~TRINITY_DN9831_c0_g1_i1.p1  ORF type:complete len:882 (-),score=118.79 TRINITY_DN9831_c0_g1_i1:130-2775(-)